MNPFFAPLTRHRRYTTAPRTWVPGEMVTAGMMNTLRDSLLEIEAGTANIKGTIADKFTIGGPSTNSSRLALKGNASHTSRISLDTVDGADNQALILCASGIEGWGRGASITLTGEEHGWPGNISLNTGTTSSSIYFNTGNAGRMVIFPSGGIGIGAAPSDPGIDSLSVVGNIYRSGARGEGTGSWWSLGYYAGVDTITLALSTAAAISYCAMFMNNTGRVGYIHTNGATTYYITSSDERMKTDRGRLLETDVLDRIIIHDFSWIADGKRGRGVFAQEVFKIAPYAVMEGKDGRHENGHLLHPWGVDYAKFVPDLIVGWQQHERQMTTLLARIAALETQ